MDWALVALGVGQCKPRSWLQHVPHHAPCHLEGVGRSTAISLHASQMILPSTAAYIRISLVGCPSRTSTMTSVFRSRHGWTYMSGCSSAYVYLYIHAFHVSIHICTSTNQYWFVGTRCYCFSDCMLHSSTCMYVCKRYVGAYAWVLVHGCLPQELFLSFFVSPLRGFGHSVSSASVLPQSRETESLLFTFVKEVTSLSPDCGHELRQ